MDGTREKRETAIQQGNKLALIGLSLCVAFTTFAIAPRPKKRKTHNDTKHARKLARMAKKIRRHFRKFRGGDWARGPGRSERYQSVRSYMRSRPTRPLGRRRVIYVLPLGRFTKGQTKVVKLTAKLLGLYFSRPVKMHKPLSLSLIPSRARRKHPTWGDKQILSRYVLYKVLQPRMPRDAAAFIALTSSDLWPGRGWNFVFGEADLNQRVGVWSIYRNGNPDKSPKDFRSCLLHTVKVASHELGHIFSVPHCKAYECNMCGSNSRTESDARPLALCPQCFQKICWATQCQPLQRYKKLHQFCKTHGLQADATLYGKILRSLQPHKHPPKRR